MLRKDEFALLLDLPKSKSGQSSKKIEQITIELSKEDIALDKKKISLEKFKQEIAKITNKKNNCRT